MSKNTSVEPSTPTTSNPSINPVLQAALGSIDVQLEEELARYRRQRAGRPVMASRGLGRHQSRKSIDLMAVDQGEKTTQRPALGMSKAPEISFPFVSQNSTPNPAPSEQRQDEPRISGESSNFPASASAIPSRTLSAPLVTHAGHQPGAQELAEPSHTPESAADRGSDLVPLEPSPAPPDDYLESSEKLLQSLAQQEAEIAPKKRLTERWLTPLGIGSTLLALLLGATAIYVARNPSTLKALNWNRNQESTTSTTASNSSPSNPETQTSTANKPAMPGPNLAAPEFPEVNLDTLSHLDVNPSPVSPDVSAQPDSPDSTGIAPPAPIAPNPGVPQAGGSSDISSALLPTPNPPGMPPSRVAPVAPLPSLPRTGVPAQSSSASPTTQKPQPSAPEKTPNESSASAQGGFYYVLMDYSSDRDLQKARTVVPDAYVERFPQGTRIQLGAFDRESQAKTLLNELKRQGMNASIYHP
jgi:hypothetical protein